MEVRNWRLITGQKFKKQSTKFKHFLIFLFLERFDDDLSVKREQRGRIIRQERDTMREKIDEREIEKQGDLQEMKIAKDRRGCGG